MAKLTPDYFEDFLCAKGDMIDGSVETALANMVLLPEEFVPNSPVSAPEHDMAMIGPIADEIEELLKKHGIHYCRPYYTDDETPCFECWGEDGECCNPNCPFRD